MAMQVWRIRSRQGAFEAVKHQNKDDHKKPDSALIYVSAHNVYYVKLTIMIHSWATLIMQSYPFLIPGHPG